MELEFVVPGIGGHEPICLCNGEFLRRLCGGDLENLKCLLDAFGKKSAAAQGLGAVVTDIHKLKNTDQRLYLFATRQGDHTLVHGGLKIGTKKLFVIADDNSLQEITPTCVLDFYVHESCQRKGIGKQLFEHFLASENQHPGNVAYDRPSPKLLAFLGKHYGLHGFIPQNNNFVVFNVYWSLNPQKGSNRHRRDGLSSYPYQWQPSGLSKTVPSPRSMHASPPLADCSNVSRPAFPPYAQQPQAFSSLASPSQASCPPSTGPSAHLGMSSTQPVCKHPAMRTSISVPVVPLMGPQTHAQHSPHSPCAPPLEPQGAGAAAAQPKSPAAQPAKPPPPWAPPAQGQGDSLDEFRGSTSGSRLGGGGPGGFCQHGAVHALGAATAPAAGGGAQAPAIGQAGPAPHGMPPLLTARQAMGMEGPRSGPLSYGSSTGGTGFRADIAHDPRLHAQQVQPMATPPRYMVCPPWGEYNALAEAATSGSGRLRGGTGGPYQTSGLPTQAGVRQQLQQQPLPPQQAVGSALGAAGGSVSKAAARAQRSGSGAASCLVW